jgi:hypothetical protein
MTTHTCTECGIGSQNARFSFLAVLASGIAGYLAGVVAESFQLTLPLAGAFAGYIGFMGAQTLSLIHLLWNSRYRGSAVIPE